MPTYEYTCRSCGEHFEEIHKISDPPITTCPKCGKDTAQRLISQGNFILKGSGWYVTGGYGTSGTSKSESASSSSPSTSSSTPSTSSSTSTSSSSTSSSSSSTSSTPSTPSTPSSTPSSGGSSST